MLTSAHDLYFSTKHCVISFNFNKYIYFFPGWLIIGFHVDILGLTLDSSSKDFVDGKVVGVNHDLYMKGCVKDVSQGIKVGYWTVKMWSSSMIL